MESPDFDYSNYSSNDSKACPCCPPQTRSSRPPHLWHALLSGQRSVKAEGRFQSIRGLPLLETETLDEVRSPQATPLASSTRTPRPPGSDPQWRGRRSCGLPLASHPYLHSAKSTALSMHHQPTPCGILLGSDLFKKCQPETRSVKGVFTTWCQKTSMNRQPINRPLFRAHGRARA